MDLRTHPRWRPLRGTLHCGDWEVSLWCEPQLPGARGVDPYCVAVAGGRLRLAVADPAATCPDLSADEVAWSGHLAISALQVHDDLESAFALAATKVHDPSRAPRLSNACAQLAGVDLDLESGAVHAMRAGDCEVWVRQAGQWLPALAGPRLTEAAAAAFAAHPGASRSAGVEAHYRAHVETLDDPTAWVTAPIGLDPVPLTEQASLATVEEVIVASDGARLDADKCRRLQSWLTGDLQVAPVGHPHPSPHGDVTVLHARRRRAGVAMVHCSRCGVRLEQQGPDWVTIEGEYCCEAPQPG